MNEPINFDDTDLDRLHAAVKREKPDALPGQEPPPLWVWIGCMFAMIMGGGYAGAYMGNGSFEQGNPFGKNAADDPRGIEIVPGGDMDPFQLAMKKGATTFNNCQGCHQATGSGQPGAIPPLAGSEWVAGGTERIARIAMHGLVGPVTVKGAAYNSAMQPPPMSDADIANVLTYIRNSWGNTGTMVTKPMITKIREATKDKVGPWTGADLEQFKDKNIEGEIPAGPGATVAPAAPAATAAPAAKK